MSTVTSAINNIISLFVASDYNKNFKMAELQPLNCGQKEILVAQWARPFLKLCLTTEFTEFYVGKELTQFEQIVQNMDQRIRADSCEIVWSSSSSEQEDSFISFK